jgi:hypothetical protein
MILVKLSLLSCKDGLSITGFVFFPAEKFRYVRRTIKIVTKARDFLGRDVLRS